MERWKVNLYTLWVTQVFSLMGFGFCIPFVPFFLQDLGVSDPVQLSYYVGLSSTLPAATMAVAAPVWGIASDRYGRKMMIMRAMFFAAVLLALMGLSQSVFQFMVLRALQGVFTGTVTASMSFVSANTPENRISYALGLMTSSNFLGYSVGPFIGGMDEILLMAMAQKESSFRTDAVGSGSGPVGLMQIMPSTAKRYGIARSQLFNPHVNIEFGAKYIGDKLKHYDDKIVALSAYNQGGGAISRGSYNTRYAGRITTAEGSLTDYLVKNGYGLGEKSDK